MFSSNCGQYNESHKWGEFSEHEERGFLIITHGKRVGRVYATERNWRERTCNECHFTERVEEDHKSSEWPG